MNYSPILGKIVEAVNSMNCHESVLVYFTKCFTKNDITAKE